jgi:hypothetical protein
MAKTNEEWLQEYEYALETILAGGANVSYSVMGKTFTKTSITVLERMVDKYRQRVHVDQFGSRSTSDFSGRRLDGSPYR